jgi:aspartate-semialdehyde dehydrogenase
LDGDTIVPLELPVSATCTRVNVRDGHTEAVNVSLGRPASPQEGSTTG